jgi:hypothetical protein
MTPETINAVQAALAPVAEKLGQGAEYSWEILVKGQFAEGVATVAICLMVIIGFFTAIKPVHRYNDTLDEWDSGLPVIGFYIIGGISLLFATLCLYQGAIQIIAPEYTAIKFLIGLGQ